MKLVSEAKLESVKAAMAWNIAALLPTKERAASIASFMKVDEDEARKLIKRGQLIARERATA